MTLPLYCWHLEARHTTMTADVPPLDSSVPPSSGEEIGVWLLQANEEFASLEQLLASAPGDIRIVPRGWLTPGPCSLTALRHGPGEVLLIAGAVPLTAEWLRQVQDCGKGVVVAGSAVSAAELHQWASQAPVVFVPLDPTAESLQLAILSAEAMARREAKWRDECRQIQQRLDDRILLERAKGVLGQRFGLDEKEAYRRLRSMARRQRRALGEVARAVLDTESLLESPPATRSAVEEEAHR